ncbi:MAG: DUF2087 domain-containing protein [Candidatus Cloacimonetes bacterium]|nr:DUF2087 domain-containing protein [Candidatus Cloacimonadota bacterium]
MELNEVIELLKSLADHSRLMIMKQLLEKPQYLEELSERLNLASSTISFHLKKMENCGLIGKEKQQYYTIFYPHREILEQTILQLIGFENREEDIQMERIRKYKEKVMKAFCKDGKISKIPAQKQKRWIVFEPILDEFEFEKSYDEAEVNEKIIKYNEDYCLIRRTFIEENIFERENNIYKLTENYRRFKQGLPSDSVKHGLKESFEQSIRDKFGVTE